MMGLEPTTFCMASRRSSQLSYIRAGAKYSPASSRLDSADYADAREPSPSAIGRENGIGLEKLAGR